MIFSNSTPWINSRISSSSPRNSTSFWLFVTGQYFSRPEITSSASRGSFSTNCVMQYESGWW